MNDALKSLQKELVAAKHALKHAEEDLIFWDFAFDQADSVIDDGPGKSAIVETWQQRLINTKVEIDQAKSNIIRIESKIKAAKVLW